MSMLTGLRVPQQAISVRKESNMHTLGRVYAYTHTRTHIYIHRERERKRESVCVFLYPGLNDTQRRKKD